jgi:hypothetical protein
MEKRFLMNCPDFLNTYYESGNGDSLSFLAKVRISLHLFFCPVCAGELKNLQYIEDIMRTDFFPFSPNFESRVMQRLLESEDNEDLDGSRAMPAGFSFRLWILIGFFVLLSLSTAFFGMDFIEIADAEGLSFLLPVGLTIGLVLTCYGALFISSHLEELSNRFRLR